MATGGSDPRKRVVVTGLGVVAPDGTGKDAFWDTVVKGRSPIDYVSRFDASDLYCQVAGEVRDFDPSDYMEAADARRAGRFVHFAVAAARLAVQDAEVDLTEIEPFRMGAAIGTSVAGIANIADDVRIIPIPPEAMTGYIPLSTRASLRLMSQSGDGVKAST